MIKHLRMFCLCCLVLFAGLGFYGKNKFYRIEYLDIENNFKYTTMSNQDFLKLYPDTAKKMINDQEVTSMAQLVDQSDYILKVKNTYMFSSAHFGAFDVRDRTESINDYDNDSLTLKQTYSYDYIGCDDQFVEKYQSLKKQLDYIDK